MENVKTRGHEDVSIGIVVNGDARSFVAGRTVNDLLEHLGLHPQLIVVEHNREILDRDQFVNTEVRAGDSFELVHFVGGG